MAIVLRIIDGPCSGREFRRDRLDTFVVGRSRLASCPVADRYLSRYHFLIEAQPPHCQVRDLGSRNGTKLNGRLIEGLVPLRDGDRLEAGDSLFEIRVEPETHEFRGSFGNSGPLSDSETTPGLPPPFELFPTPRPSLVTSQTRCLECDAPLRLEERVDGLAPDDDPNGVAWICPACRDRLSRFPPPPPGYVLERWLGRGGMGSVHLGRHLQTGTRVAIKTLIPQIASHPRARAYFRREVEVMRALRHRRIVRYYGVVETAGRFQLIMEYVESIDAAQRLRIQEGPMETATVLRIGLQLLDALRHAHERGYVHRDIKPSNLLLTPRPGGAVGYDLKLADFGLARSFRDQAGLTGLTNPGDLVGTLGFLAPDLIRDARAVTQSSDLYSVGATLYYLLTREYPYLNFDPRRDDSFQVVLEHPPLPLTARRPDLPEALSRVLERALEKSPRRRWPTAAAMADALRRVAHLMPRSESSGS